MKNKMYHYLAKRMSRESLNEKKIIRYGDTESARWLSLKLRAVTLLKIHLTAACIHLEHISDSLMLMRW